MGAHRQVRTGVHWLSFTFREHGWTTTQTLRTKAPENLRTIPVIGCSGKDDVLDRVKGRLVGMNSYLAKPFAAADLVSLVQSFIID